MYIRFPVLLSVASLAAVAVAAPTELEARQTVSQCNTGPIQCCNSTYSQSDTSITSIFGLLGIVIPSSQSLLGLGCSSIAGTGSSCTQQPVCCTGNTFNGLVNIGCNPIIINL